VQENSAQALCEYEALATLRHTCLGSFFLDPEGVSLEEIWNVIKGTELP